MKRPALTSLMVIISSIGALNAEDQVPTVIVPDPAPVPAVVAEQVREHTLRTGPLSVTIDAEGTVEASQVRRMKLVMEYLNGPFVLSEIFPQDQPVEAGKVIARFDSTRLMRWLRSAQENLELSQFRAGVVAEELTSLRRGQALRLERDEQDLARIQKDWEHILAFTVEQRSRRVNNELQRTENSLLVAETELTQLDKMYRESRISDDTKDIVLERARKSLVNQRESAALARRDHQQFFERELPNEKIDWQRNLERKRQDLEQLRIAQGLADRQKVEELAKAERAVRDAQELKDGYLADQQRLAITAPFAGILRHTGMEVGDTVNEVANKNVVFAELHSAAPYQLRLLLPLKEIMLLQIGLRLRVMVPEMQRGDLEGEVITLGNIATRDAQGTPRFTVLIRIGDELRLRPGIKAKINYPVIIADALSIPRTFVTTTKGETTCEVRTSTGTTERRTINLGVGNDEHVQVLTGLVAGDVVLRPTVKKTTP